VDMSYGVIMCMVSSREEKGSSQIERSVVVIVLPTSSRTPVTVLLAVLHAGHVRFFGGWKRMYVVG